MSRWRLLAVTAGMLALAAAAVGVWLGTQEPLVAGSSGSRFTTTYRHGERFGWRMSVANDGRVPVTITRIGVGDGNQLFRAEKIHAFADHGRRAVELPTRVSPGGELWLTVDAVFSGCRHFAPGGGMTFKAIDVSYEVFGIRLRTWVDLGDVFAIRAPERCPES